MFFESLFEGSFRFADVTGFTVLARQLVYYTAFVLGMVLVFFYYRNLNVAVSPTLDYRCYCRGVHMNVAVGTTFGQRLKVSSNYRYCANVARTETRLSNC